VTADLALATVVYRADSSGALKIMDAALQQHPLDSLPALDRPSADIALVYAMAGQHTRARQLLAAYESQVPEGIRRGHWEWYQARGWLALVEARPRDAILAFTQGRKADDCPDCGAWDEGVAYERAGQGDSAFAAYQRAVDRGTGLKAAQADAWGLAPSLKRLGEIYETRGDKQRALDSYGRFVALWKDADPVLQPTVREVRTRMAQLAGEGKR
jgi:tetratricopeptide (TPR) repeat protein